MSSESYGTTVLYGNQTGLSLYSMNFTTFFFLCHSAFHRIRKQKRHIHRIIRQFRKDTTSSMQNCRFAWLQLGWLSHFSLFLFLSFHFLSFALQLSNLPSVAGCGLMHVASFQFVAQLLNIHP